MDSILDQCRRCVKVRAREILILDKSGVRKAWSFHCGNRHHHQHECPYFVKAHDWLHRPYNQEKTETNTRK